MSGVSVRDVTLENVEDVFHVCSHGNPLEHRGFLLKRNWIRSITARLGPVSKVAYLDGKPVAQALFIPEEAIPCVEHPRRGVLQLRCVYNPFKEARGRGAATSLVKDLISDCAGGLKSLQGMPCSFIVAEAFNTGEGLSLGDFYAGLGFKGGEGELYYSVTGGYAPRKPSVYRPTESDAGKAYVIYNPTCEYLPVFADKVKALIEETAPAVPVTLVDEWRNPRESMRLGNHWLTVNKVQIQGSWTDRERLRLEIRKAAA